MFQYLEGRLYVTKRDTLFCAGFPASIDGFDSLICMCNPAGSGPSSFSELLTKILYLLNVMFCGRWLTDIVICGANISSNAAEKLNVDTKSSKLWFSLVDRMAVSKSINDKCPCLSLIGLDQRIEAVMMYLKKVEFAPE